MSSPAHSTLARQTRSPDQTRKLGLINRFVRNRILQILTTMEQGHLVISDRDGEHGFGNRTAPPGLRARLAVHKPSLYASLAFRESRKNISQRYDLGNDFFSLFLDEAMMYSCALFASESSTLQEASLAKIDRVCRLHLNPSDHVMEIGAGWAGKVLPSTLLGTTGVG